MGLEKQLQSKSSMTSTTRAPKTGTKIQNTVKFNTYALIFDTLFEKVMGNKDKTRDENATTSTGARDRDQESRDAALARIITEAV